MKCWEIRALGQAATLSQQAAPIPQKGEALIAIEAAGLNFADLLMAEGKYQERKAAPFIPGLELAGRIVALGPETPGPAIGARVAAHVAGGAFAEQAVVPIDRLLVLPETMPMEIAAGFMVAYGTSHLALEEARLKAGETLYVSGASGGVGLTAVEIGHAMGARVIASVRGAEKAAIAKAAGADVVIDSETPDLKAALKDLGGIDVTYDTVGGAGFDAAMRATRPGGRMLAIGFAGGNVPQVPLNQLLVRNISVIGLWWGGYLNFAPKKLTDSLAALLQMWEAGKLSPHISASLPFEQLPEGLEMIRSRRATGKVVITL